MTTPSKLVPNVPENVGRYRVQTVVFTAAAANDTVGPLSFRQVLVVEGNLPGAVAEPTYNADTGVLSFAGGLTIGHVYRLRIRGL